MLLINFDPVILGSEKIFEEPEMFLIIFSFSCDETFYHFFTELGDTSHLVISFKDEECKSSKIVGGKAASLALMTSLINSTTEIVRTYFCSTLCQ